MDSRIRTFKRAIFDFIRPVPTPMFKINWLLGFVFLIWLRVGFSHLREHKFRHGFLDIVDHIYTCRFNAVENTEHYLLYCSNFANQRTVLFDDLRNTGINYGPLDSSTLSRMLLFGNSNFSDNVNRGIIYAVIKFIVSTSRFSGSIYDKFNSEYFLFPFYFLSLFCFKVNLDYFFFRAVFLAISVFALIVN